MLVRTVLAVGLTLGISSYATGQTPIPNLPGDVEERLREAAQDRLLEEADIIQPIETEEPDLPSTHYIHRNISCPSPYVVEVTSEIGGWTPSFQSGTWNSPSSLEVGDYSGYGEHLICTYGHDIFQLHLAPPADMPVCVVDGNSFNCRPEGDFLNRRDEQLIEPSQRVDMDYSAQGIAHDFWYRADTPTQQSFEAIGSARLVQMNVTSSERLSVELCRRSIENVGRTSYNRQEMQVGNFYCFRSTSSRYGYFQVLGYEGDQAPYSIRIRHVSWANAG